MKNNKIGFGIFLVFIGIILILINTGVINWSIMNAMFTLWPLFIIVIGVNIIFKHNQLARLITWIVFLAILVTYGYYNQSSTGHPFNNMRTPIVRTSSASDPVLIEKAAETKNAVFNLEVGAMNFDIGATNNGLVDAKIDSKGMSYDVNYINDKETAVVKFENDVQFILGERVERNATFLLNDGINWDMEIDVGAVNGFIDLSALNVDKLNIDCGAAEIDLKLGKKSQNLNIIINSGVSKIGIELPKDVGLKLVNEGALNKINASGIKLNKDGRTYTSENYSSSSYKIDINASMGLGQIEITGY